MLLESLNESNVAETGIDKLDKWNCAHFYYGIFPSKISEFNQKDT